ncbi:MAG TPA: DUF2127 domain-containing protein [Gemmatimonadaceae bacterium]|nr:DUF2127 domain-containing protein [Gemmatimonadaceae bacterium]
MDRLSKSRPPAPAGTTLHRLFDLGVILKGIDGVLEVIGGAVIAAAGPRTLNAAVLFLTAHELSEDPHDVVANLLRHGVAQLSSNTTLFASAYLVGHGVVKLILVAGLLRERRWAFPAALWFMGAFVVYEGYRIALTRSPALMVLTAVDLGVLVLIWREYRWRARAR